MCWTKKRRKIFHNNLEILWGKIFLEFRLHAYFNRNFSFIWLCCCSSKLKYCKVAHFSAEIFKQNFESILVREEAEVFSLFTLTIPCALFCTKTSHNFKLVKSIASFFKILFVGDFLFLPSNVVWDNSYFLSQSNMKHSSQDKN